MRIRILTLLPIVATSVLATLTVAIAAVPKIWLVGLVVQAVAELKRHGLL